LRLQLERHVPFGSSPSQYAPRLVWYWTFTIVRHCETAKQAIGAHVCAGERRGVVGDVVAQLAKPMYSTDLTLPLPHKLGGLPCELRKQSCEYYVYTHSACLYVCTHTSMCACTHTDMHCMCGAGYRGVRMCVHIHI
jgi:hypothetical protein